MFDVALVLSSGLMEHTHPHDLGTCRGYQAAHKNNQMKRLLQSKDTGLLVPISFPFWVSPSMSFVFQG